MGFFYRLIFRYLLRRAGYSAFILHPIPNFVSIERNINGRWRTVEKNHGWYEDVIHWFKVQRWKIEDWVDKRWGFMAVRGEWLGLWQEVQTIKHERWKKACGR